MTDSHQLDLARRAAGGDRAALEALWLVHRRFVATVLVANGAGDELDDLLQEVALSVCKHIGELKQPDRCRSWLRSVALNRMRSRGRHIQTRPVELHRLGDQADQLEQPVAAGTADADRVLELIERIEMDYREPLLLKTVKGLSQKQIATALDLPVTTVETRLTRARKMLRQLLAREARQNDSPVATTAARASARKE